MLSLAALALGWIAVVAIMAEVGFTGTRRYLAAPAAALCVVAGVGLVWLLDAVRERRARIALGVAVAVLALVPALLRAREDARMLSVARSQADSARRAGARGRPRRRPRRRAAPRAPRDQPVAADGAGLGARRAAVGRAGHLVVVAPPPALGAAGARLPRPGAAGRAPPGAAPAACATDVVTRSGRWRVLRAAA